MNVIYSSSDSYAEICGISLTSLLENNKSSKEINVFIIDNGISEKNREKLGKTVKNYNRKLTFLPKPEIEKLVTSEIYTGRWNIGTFFRLFLASLLPENIDRIAYIDCDMIIRHSLEEIFNLDMGKCSVAGVDDCRSDLYRKDIGLPNGALYINNGFMVVDLKKWRKENVQQEFVDFISDRKGDCTYMDQAPLNGILSKRNEIYELEAKYNAQRIFFDFSFKRLMKLRKPNKHLSEKEYNDAITDPVIVHFTPTFLTGSRPWQKKDKHKFANEYRHYKSISEWKDEPYRKDDRKLPKKIMTIICKCTPRFILIPIMSYLHATWYPKKRIKIYSKNKSK